MSTEENTPKRPLFHSLDEVGVALRLCGGRKHGSRILFESEEDADTFREMASHLLFPTETIEVI